MAPKRVFYEDDELVVPQPGLNKEISEDLKEKESIKLNENVSMFQGMTIRAPEFANRYMRQIRMFLYEKAVLVENELSTSKSAIENELALVKQSYHEIVQEPVLPSLLDILTATLTGSIIARNRALPIRFISPVLFGAVVFAYTMPRTYYNTTDTLSHYEKQFPEVYKTHKQLEYEISKAFQAAFVFKDDANKQLVQEVAKARKYLKDLIDK